MKISVPQILASAAGAVLAALIASLFGVKGTVIGVGIGSVVATTGTAFAAQWIERTHRAVRQVVVGMPGQERTVRLSGRPGAPGKVTRVPAVPGEHTPEGQTVPRVSPGAGPGRRVRWRTYVGAVGVVLATALLVVTAVELVAGRSLSALIGAGGSAGSGPSVSDIFDQPNTTVTAPTTTTTTGVPAESTPTTTTTAAGSGASTPTTTTTAAGSGASTPTTTTTTTSTTTTTTTTAPSTSPAPAGSSGSATATTTKPTGG